MRKQDRQTPGDDRPKPDPSSAAPEIFLTDEQLAARWQVSPKTLRNAQSFRPAAQFRENRAQRPLPPIRCHRLSRSETPCARRAGGEE